MLYEGFCNRLTLEKLERNGNNPGKDIKGLGVSYLMVITEEMKLIP